MPSLTGSAKDAAVMYNKNRVDRMNTKPNTFATIFIITFGLMLIGGLAVVPIIEEAQAANSVSESKNKGQQGDSSSGGKRSGIGGCNGCG